MGWEADQIIRCFWSVNRCKFLNSLLVTGQRDLVRVLIVAVAMSPMLREDFQKWRLTGDALKYTVETHRVPSYHDFCFPSVSNIGVRSAKARAVIRLSKCNSLSASDQYLSKEQNEACDYFPRAFHSDSPHRLSISLVVSNRGTKR